MNCLANFVAPNFFVNFAVNYIVPSGGHGSTSDNLFQDGTPTTEHRPSLSSQLKLKVPAGTGFPGGFALLEEERREGAGADGAAVGFEGE